MNKTQRIIIAVLLIMFLIAYTKCAILMYQDQNIQSVYDLMVNDDFHKPFFGLQEDSTYVCILWEVSHTWDFASCEYDNW